MRMLNELQELLNAKVIDQTTAERIRAYYKEQEKSSAGRLIIVFALLGAILVGLGIILIIAHNWDHLSRGVKTVFAFFPLLLGQIACGYVLLKQRDRVAWIESSTTFLIFGIGTAISLVSQIYHIPGEMSSFVLTWIVLAWPLIFIMNSSAASLLYLVGITYYTCEVAYWSYPESESYLYWLLLAVGIPHYFRLYREKPGSNFMFFHNWLIPLSVIISLGAMANDHGNLMFVAYLSLFGIFSQFGNLSFFQKQKGGTSGYEILGAMGTVLLLLILSFDGFWEQWLKESLSLGELLVAPEFYAALILSSGAFYLLFRNYKQVGIKALIPLDYVFLLFVVIFIIGKFAPVATVLMNMLVFFIGIQIIRRGAKLDHLGILNFGLLIITALIICRFFDTNLSFVMRGVLFVTVGIGFFLANHSILKNRRNHER